MPSPPAKRVPRPGRPPAGYVRARTRRSERGHAARVTQGADGLRAPGGLLDLVQLGRRLAVEQPRVSELRHVALAPELLERRGDRRPARGDEVGEQLVRQPQRHADAVRRDPPPTVGEVPHEHQQAAVDPRVVRDRHGHHERARALHGAADQRAAHLGVRRRAAREALVEQRELGLLDDAERRVERQRDVLAVVLPRTHEVAGPEQLRAVAADAPDAAHDEPVEQQQSGATAHALAGLLRVPRALERHRSRGDEVTLGAPQAVALEPTREVRVTHQHMGDVRGHPAIVAGAAGGSGRGGRAASGALRMICAMTTAVGREEHLTFRANAEATRYGWLRLTPAYSVHLVSALLDRHAAAGTLVLDPYCGTGTTALVCAERGVECVTTDINPFLVWLARAKTARYTPDALAAFEAAAASVEDAIRADGEPEWLPPLLRIDKWWEQPTLHALGRAMAAIRAAGDDPRGAADLLRLAFCRVLIARASVSFGHQSMSFKRRVAGEARLPAARLVGLAAEAWTGAVAALVRSAATPIGAMPR